MLGLGNMEAKNLYMLIKVNCTEILDIIMLTHFKKLK